METFSTCILEKIIYMKIQLIASAIALIAFGNVGYAQEGKTKKMNHAKSSLHRAPPPPPVFVQPVIVPDETVDVKGNVAPAPPIQPAAPGMVQLAPPPPPPPLPVEITKVTFKAPPPPPLKQKN